MKMQLWDKFTFGQYKNLILFSVYQGTLNINTTLLANYLNNCIEKGVDSFSSPMQLEFCQVFVSEECIIIQPQIFDEEKPYSEENSVYLGDLSLILESYFNNFFSMNMRGTLEDFVKFNARTAQEIIGGDPEYIEWCLRKKIIDISYDTKKSLESLQVYRLSGVHIRSLALNKYLFIPKYKTELYRFRQDDNLEVHS